MDTKTTVGITNWNMVEEQSDILKNKIKNVKKAAIKNMFQAIVLTTEDGEEHYFSGPASLLEGDTIINIKIGKPIDMPDDTEFVDFKDI